MSDPVLLEALQPLQLLLCRPQLQRASQVFVLDSVLWGGRQENLEYLRRLVPDRNVHLIYHQEYPDLYFAAGHNLPKAVNSRLGALDRIPIIARLGKLYGIAGVVTGVKKNLAAGCHRQEYLRLVAESLVGELGTLWVVPATNDDFGFLRNAVGVRVPRLVSLVNRVRRFGMVFRAWAKFFFIMGNRLKQIRVRVHPRSVDFGCQVAWPNFAEIGPSKGENRCRFDSAFFLDGQTIRFNNTLFLFGIWAKGFGAETVASMKAFLSSRNAPYADSEFLGPDLQHVVEMRLGRYLWVAPSLIGAMLRFPTQATIADAAVSLLYHLDNEEIFCRHFRPSAFLSHDDQGLQHVARTLVFERHGLKNLGMGHSAYGGPAVLPSLAYIYFHDYLAIGPLIRDLYHPFWDGQSLSMVGLPRGALIRDSINNKLRKQAFVETFGCGPTILILPFGTNAWHLPDRIGAFYDALVELLRQRPRCRLILRPRIQPDGRMNWHEDLALRVLGPAIKSGQAILCSEGFDSQELMAFADLTITCLASSTVVELLSAGKKVITYNSNGLDGFNPMTKVDTRLVANTGEELLDRIFFFLDDPDAEIVVSRLRESFPVEAFTDTRAAVGLRLVAARRIAITANAG